MTQDGLNRIMDVLLEGHQLRGWSGARAERDELQRGDGRRWHRELGAGEWVEQTA